MIKMRNNKKYEGERQMRQFYLPLLFLYPFIVLNIDYGWMMGGDHMMDWWGIPFMGFWMMGIWLVFIVIAFLVYQDANKREMNGLLWFILVILPWIGIVFFVVYLVIREEKNHPQSTTKRTVEQILDERYAKGEIMREEYQQKKNDIGKGK
jgi:putative membrane protein